MEGAEVAEARARGYHLLGRLLAVGPVQSLRDAASQVPALAAALPTERDDDAVAADHHALFGFDILPYEGVFRAADGLLGGPATAAVASSYAAAGWIPPDDGESADHAAVELAFLAWAAGIQADAARAGDEGRALRAARAQRHFLETHLLHWLPALAAAVASAGPRDGAPFYAAVLGLAVDLAADHVQDVPMAADQAQDVEADGTVGIAEDGAPDAAERLLAEPRTGLRDIARFLTSPARAGVYLGRGAVVRAARTAGVPHGFGDRTSMLGDALSAAAHLDRVGELARALDEEVAAQARWVAARRVVAGEAGLRILERALAPWAERAAGSRLLLGRVAVQAGAGLANEA